MVTKKEKSYIGLLLTAFPAESSKTSYFNRKLLWELLHSQLIASHMGSSLKGSVLNFWAISKVWYFKLSTLLSLTVSQSTRVLIRSYTHYLLTGLNQIRSTAHTPCVRHLFWRFWAQVNGPKIVCLIAKHPRPETFLSDFLKHIHHSGTIRGA